MGSIASGYTQSSQIFGDLPTEEQIEVEETIRKLRMNPPLKEKLKRRRRRRKWLTKRKERKGKKMPRKNLRMQRRKKKEVKVKEKMPEKLRMRRKMKTLNGLDDAYTGYPHPILHLGKRKISSGGRELRMMKKVLTEEADPERSLFVGRGFPSLRRREPCKGSIIPISVCWQPNHYLAKHRHPVCAAAPGLPFPAELKTARHRSQSSCNSLSMGELVSRHPPGLLGVWEVLVIGAPAPAYWIQTADLLTSTPSSDPASEERGSPRPRRSGPGLGLASVLTGCKPTATSGSRAHQYHPRTGAQRPQRSGSEPTEWWRQQAQWGRDEREQRSTRPELLPGHLPLRPIPTGQAEGPHQCTNPCTGPLVFNMSLGYTVGPRVKSLPICMHLKIMQDPDPAGPTPIG
ncbi:hypothetical protein QTO34_014762 [Cnephaeus nilssonii]|uniref:Uncharacterized protein n=1 Tax=Cnephaeus nilssonii TaxID=3371016 RepID=A0AA40I6Y7_CNENI|nr:hypothetical protein QTO34_014762 [Eptesicus nilssonii]